MKKILIVEDEPSAVKVMQEKFTHEGFEVILAANGEEGLDKAYSLHPDIILLDIIMPRMDGMTMLRRLRGEDGDFGKNVPVIILSNLTPDDQQVKDLVNFGPECYLVKADWKLGDVLKKVKETLKMG